MSKNNIIIPEWCKYCENKTVLRKDYPCYECIIYTDLFSGQLYTPFHWKLHFGFKIKGGT